MKKVRQLMFAVGLFTFCIIGSLMQTEVTTVVVQNEKYASSQRSTQINLITFEMYYNATQEERSLLEKLVYAEAGNDDLFGKVLVANVSINNTYAQGYKSVIEDITSGRYNPVIDGEVYLISTDSDGNKIKRLITDDMVDQETKDAVEIALKREYSEQFLKEEAERLGIHDPKYYEGGARYFCNPKAISEGRSNERQYIKVKPQHGNHVFYLYWNKSESDL